MTDFFELYDTLIDGMDSNAIVTGTLMGECWTAVETVRHFGMAMTTPVDTAPRILSGEYTGMSLKEYAEVYKLDRDLLLTKELDLIYERITK